MAAALQQAQRLRGQLVGTVAARRARQRRQQRALLAQHQVTHTLPAQHLVKLGPGGVGKWKASRVGSVR